MLPQYAGSVAKYPVRLRVGPHQGQDIGNIWSFSSQRGCGWVDSPRGDRTKVDG